MTLAEPVFVGYFPKQTQASPQWLKSGSAKEICSVSTCISDGPADWMEQWRHNALGFYDTEALAWQVVGSASAGFEMYAYAIYPYVFADGAVRPWQVEVSLKLDLAEYNFLGYDLVNRTTGSNFERSPLSCNGLAADFQVNRFCLMDDPLAAFQTCLLVSTGLGEPGPYYLFRVYRRSLKHPWRSLT